MEVCPSLLSVAVIKQDGQKQVAEEQCASVYRLQFIAEGT